MKKQLDVKEVRPPRRDPRAEDDDPSRVATAGPRSPEELMLALGRPAPSPASETGPRDLFGIVGTTVDELFRVERVVAHGGFSVIYQATHLRFGATTALKCLKLLPTQTRAEREDFLGKFKTEGELMFRLSQKCPEVVRPLHIDSFRTKDGQVVPYIALEWLDGETLRDRIIRRLEDDKPAPGLARAVTILGPVARVLARAHDFPSPGGRLAILHCDLKPDNIFLADVDGVETIKIFDFGISKVRIAASREAGAATTTRGPSMFTPAYAAPEQWSPEKFGQTGPWTDVFALALTLVELASQRPAFEGPGTAMLTQCLDESHRPTPRALGLEASDRVEEIFARALAVDPRDRTPTIELFWSELEEALDLPRTLGAGRSSLSGATAPIAWDEPERAATKDPERAARVQSSPDRLSQPLVPVDLGAPMSVPGAAARIKVPAPPPENAAEPSPASSPDPEVSKLPSQISTQPAPPEDPPAVRPSASRPPLPSIPPAARPLSTSVWVVAVVSAAVIVAANEVRALGLPVVAICLGILVLASAFTAIELLRARR